MAISTAVRRLAWPAPTPTSAAWRARTTALLRTWRPARPPKSRSVSSTNGGRRLVCGEDELLRGGLVHGPVEGDDRAVGRHRVPVEGPLVGARHVVVRGKAHGVVLLGDAAGG